MTFRLARDSGINGGIEKIIALRRAQRRAQIGVVILADLVRTALARGARHLTLEVRVGNEPALALYQRFGMAPVGVRRNYYPVTGDDALVMWVRDIDSENYAERLSAIEARTSPDLRVTSRA